MTTDVIRLRQAICRACPNGRVLGDHGVIGCELLRRRCRASGWDGPDPVMLFEAMMDPHAHCADADKGEDRWALVRVDRVVDAEEADAGRGLRTVIE